MYKEGKKLPTIDVCTCTSHTYIAELHISQCISKATSCYIFHICIHHFYVLLICEAQQFFFSSFISIQFFLDHKKAVFTFNFLCASTAYFYPILYIGNFFLLYVLPLLHPQFFMFIPIMAAAAKKVLFFTSLFTIGKKCLEWE